MSKRSLCFFVRVAIIMVFICGVCICAGLYPFLVSLNGLNKGIEAVMWSQLIFYWITSIPCFMILGVGWKISSSITDELFTNKNAKYLKISAIILFVDSVVFLIGNLVFMIMEYNVFAIVFFMLDIIALVVSLALGVAGYYVKTATNIREENESFI